MSKKELYDFINGLCGDLEFEYKGIHGAICPFSRSNIVMGYGDKEKTLSSVEDVMSDNFFDGECLNDISNELDIF